ncbi:unnamed protein product [Pleuronectes platessa]|uniref:Sodium channel modifier 1 n=1 Tax=Pleuronectes platessa TaxID=8262 RepID=A0A9N7YMM3_PLEPL|nr:unnamed protein product [Pleuronectes platessa]
MSFKREGDDKSQLNILKKRRVEDLLSHFIPEDEAVLMRNGRYSCIVCSYRPVFDTVDMLTVHRNGKKHLEGLQLFYGKKARLKNEIIKRRQEDSVQAEDAGQEPSSSAPLLEQTRKLTYHALLKTVPYNSCHRKTSTKCEKEPASINSDISGNAQRETSSGPEHTSEASDSAASRSCSGSTADNKELNPSHDVEASQPITAERRRELEHYLKLKSDGWKQDLSGRWIRDEDVEFDSDEEEPPSLVHSED